MVEFSSGFKARMGPSEWGSLIVLSVLWGAAFFFIAIVLEELPPMTLAALRVILALITMWILVALAGTEIPRAPRIWLWFIVVGLLNNVFPFSLIAWGQTHIASGLASIMNATTPLFTVVVAHMFTQDEKATPRRVAGVVVGLAGVAVIIGIEALETLGGHVFGQLAVLGAAFSYSFAGVFGRRFRALGVSPLAVTTGQITTASMILLPLMLVIDRPWTLAAPSLATWSALLCLAIPSTAFAYVIYFKILGRAGANNLQLVTFLIPVSGVLLGTLLLGERLETKHFLGMALIGLGLAAIDGRLLDRVVRLTAQLR